MNLNFTISAIENIYNHLFSLDETDLFAQGGIRMIVDEMPGTPCRVSLEDAEVGEEVILFPYQHHNTQSPYQASGPIFIRKDAKSPTLKENEIPKMLRHRLLSLRVYDVNGMMIDATTTQGENLKNEIEVIFNNLEANFIHVHNAGPGCYNCRVDRVD